MSDGAEEPAAPDPEARATRRRRLGQVALVIGLLVLGGLILIVTGLSEGGVFVGSSIMGIGGVAAISAFFYEVGAGEDRERARRPPS